MAGLMGAVEKKGLRKAGDSSHDPADLSASTEVGGTASIPASGNASESAIDTDSQNASGIAVSNASGNTSRKAVTKDGGNDVGNAGRAAGKNAGGTASRKAGKKSKKGRRLGRPAGPDRRPLSVRILTEIDDALTDAVNATGRSPQYIADEALRSWLVEHGYLDERQQQEQEARAS